MECPTTAVQTRTVHPALRRNLTMAAAGVTALGLSAIVLPAGAAPAPQIEAALPPASQRKVAPALQQALLRAPGKQRVILELRTVPSAEDRAGIRRAGASISRSYRVLPMVAVTASPTSVSRLAALPTVRWISPDLGVKRTLEFASTAVGARDGAWVGNARTGFRGLTGKGVTVAVIDSGINPTDDIRDPDKTNGAPARIVAGFDWIAGSATDYGNDGAGHGTCVAGILAGNGYDSTFAKQHGYCYRNFIGIAPQASLVNLRVLNKYGFGTTSAAIGAIDYAIANKDRYRIRIINLSLGHLPVESYTTDPLCQACESAWKAGILVVCAAGNRGRLVPDNPNGGVAYGGIDSPGDDPYVLTVGAANDMRTLTRADDVITTYSSRGPALPDLVLKPDIVAPGNKIVAMRNPNGYLQKVLGPQNTVPTSYYWVGPAVNTTGYFTFSGTSMAAPMVSGAAAILLQADPTLTPDSIKARLMKSADKAWRSGGTVDDIYSRGAGYLNIPAALAMSDIATLPALSPTMVQNSDGTVDIGTVLWGDQAIWGKNALWGDQAIWGKETISGDQAIWGKNALWGDQAIWGKCGLGGDQAIWGKFATFINSTVLVDMSPTALDGD